MRWNGILDNQYTWKNYHDLYPDSHDDDFTRIITIRHFAQPEILTEYIPIAWNLPYNVSNN